MATTGVNATFVDTNVLIYSTVVQSPFHSSAMQRLKDLSSATVPLWVSRQILREYLAGITRPGSHTTPISATQACADVITFERRFLIAEDGPSVTSQLLKLLASIPCAGKQVHDANIVATMLAHGVTTLLTHNVVDFQRFGSLITIMPM